MPSLTDILKHTFVRTADPGATVDPTVSAHVWHSDVSYPIGKDEETQRIWSYTLTPPTATAGPKVTKLFCRVRDASPEYRLQQVATDVSWGPVKVHIKRGGKLVGEELPLTSKFVLNHVNTNGGSVSKSKASDAKFWKLESQTDIGFETTFGYHWYPDGFPAGDPEARVQPIPTAMVSPSAVMVDAADFMPDPGSKPPPPEVVASGGTVKVRPIRVIVTVTLGLGKERADWEPGETIGVGRMYPLIMVMSDHDLDLVDSTITVKRPKQCLTNGNACHPEAPGDVGSVFFTDANVSTLMGNLPTWDVTFDYFDIKPKDGRYRMVRRDRWKDGRTADPAWLENQEAKKVGDGIGIGSFHMEKGATPHVVTKKGFQGEFDNLHIAPRMQGKAKRKPYVTAAWGLDDVAMAPFCLADCLHMHWRWGTGGPPGGGSMLGLRGWSGTDKPNAIRGNPMVPQNQDVFVDLFDNGSSFRVFTQAYDCKAGTWQVVFHNGAAYGLSIGTFGQVIRGLPEFDPPIIDGVTALTPWPEMYWHLRFTGWEPHKGKPAEFFERLNIKDIAKLRDL